MKLARATPITVPRPSSPRESTSSGIRLKGTLLEERYALGEEIREGGIGVIHLGRDNRTGRQVAIKSISDSNRDNIHVWKMFAIEAEALRLIRSPYVVSLLDYCQTKHNIHLVLERVEGLPMDIEPRFKSRGIRELLEVYSRVCQALSDTHAAGVVHRDIKPDNIIVYGTGNSLFVKVIDFGCSRVPHLDDPYGDCHIMGTPAYLAPETLCRPREELDHRIDIYSLGVTMYEGFGGDLPRRPKEQTAEALIEMHEEEHLPLDKRNPAIHPLIAHIVEKAMRYHPECRYSTAQEMKADIQLCMDIC